MTAIGVVDTLMVAPLGTLALSAAGLTATFMTLCYSFLYGLVSVSGVGIATALGGEDMPA